ncbi:MAG: hypothetical protein QW228_03685 [Candidatus Aenigmatarchaeota archaeon]
MNFIFLALGVIDACVATLLYFGLNLPLLGNFAIYFAYIILFKSIISIISSLPFHVFDWLGILDLIAGVVLILICFGVNHEIFHIFSFIYAFKVFYVLVRTIFNF